jgi:hypothetical protein
VVIFLHRVAQSIHWGTVKKPSGDWNNQVRMWGRIALNEQSHLNSYSASKSAKLIEAATGSEKEFI